jgi:hypothetical protein
MLFKKRHEKEIGRNSILGTNGIAGARLIVDPLFPRCLGDPPDCPTGKSAQPVVSRCLSPFAKIFFFALPPNQIYIPHRPTSLEGRFAIVTDARRDAVDADALLTNGAEADGEDVWS